MEQAIGKAKVLVEALPYIQRFRGATVVIKVGGSAMEVAEHLHGMLMDVTFMECIGMKAVIVHGGGKAISRRMAEQGLESRFLKGLRVTCEKTIEVVEHVVKGEVNPRIVNLLRELGAQAEPLHGDEILTVKRKREVDAETGETLDWGFVGEPREVDTAPIEALLARGVIPVITPLGIGADGAVHNVNADTVAAAVARALKARKLVYLSDVPGLLRDAEDPASLMSHLAVSDVTQLIDAGVIAGGMLPKVKSCVEALGAGVKKIHMVDGRMSHSLLLEIFTDKGVGTEIVI